MCGGTLEHAAPDSKASEMRPQIDEADEAGRQRHDETKQYMRRGETRREHDKT